MKPCFALLLAAVTGLSGCVMQPPGYQGQPPQQYQSQGRPVYHPRSASQSAPGPDTSDPVFAQMAAAGLALGLDLETVVRPNAAARCRAMGGTLVPDITRSVPLAGGEQVYIPNKCLRPGQGQ
jgi:hypothetical protein